MAKGDSGKGGGLSSAETAALRSYSGSDYGRINAQLRQSGTLSGVDSKTASKLDKALDKLPAHSGTLWRGEDLTLRNTSVDQFLGRYEVGKTVTVNQYLSTTTEKSIMEEAHTGATGIKIGIKSKGQNGRIIPHDINPYEKEVLFKRGTSFRVVRRERSTDGKTGLLVLEEI